jgi:hypothetical protein
MLFGLLRRSESAKSSPRFYLLADGARRALEIATIEKLPLAYIASRNGEGKAQYWFADNLLRIVCVEGRKPGTTANEALNAEKIDGLTLDEDMRAIRLMGSPEPSYVDLRIPRAEFVKYLEWLRTTQ